MIQAITKNTPINHRELGMSMLFGILSQTIQIAVGDTNVDCVQPNRKSNTDNDDQLPKQSMVGLGDIESRFVY